MDDAGDLLPLARQLIHEEGDGRIFPPPHESARTEERKPYHAVARGLFRPCDRAAGDVSAEDLKGNRNKHHKGEHDADPLHDLIYYFRYLVQFFS